MTTSSDIRAVLGADPVAVGRAFGRVNLIGDHTDYNDGFVLPAAIPQQTTVAVAPADTGFELYSAALGERSVIAGLGEPVSGYARYVVGCCRVLEARGVGVPPLKFWIGSDVPIGVGLSSSAALEVATLRALDRCLDLELDPVDLAKLAQRAEIEHAGVECGIMDQFACSIAEPGRMLFLDTLSLEYELVPLPVGAEILIVDSGHPRQLAASAYNARRQECRESAALLGLSSLREANLLEVERLPEPLKRRARHVVAENARVREAVRADAVTFGRLMDQSHASLRDDYDVSVQALDELAARLRSEPEVYGARLTGAGFGGSCVALVQRGYAAEVGRRLTEGRSPETSKWRVIVPKQERGN